MDSLDGSLYSQVLSSLAANIASTPRSNPSDVLLLSTPLLDLPPSTSSQSYTNGPLDSENVLVSLLFPLSLFSATLPIFYVGFLAHLPMEPQTVDQVEGIIAFAEYVKALRSQDETNLKEMASQVVDLVKSLRGWQVEAASGLSGEPGVSLV